MRVPRAIERPLLGINLTPMIDVSFLLIIFFIVSGHLAQQEAQQEIDLPQAASGREPAHLRERRVIINVDSAGQLNIAGEAIPADNLQARVTAEHARVGDELEVRIRSDRRVEYRHIEPILLACSRAGVWKVTFAVYRREPT